MNLLCCFVIFFSHPSLGLSLNRLLYFMVLKYRNCGHSLPAESVALDFHIYTLCALIWHERNLIVEMNTPNALKDLFIEQSM